MWPIIGAVALLYFRLSHKIDKIDEKIEEFRKELEHKREQKFDHMEQRIDQKFERLSEMLVIRNQLGRGNPLQKIK